MKEDLARAILRLIAVTVALLGTVLVVTDLVRMCSQNDAGVRYSTFVPDNGVDASGLLSSAVILLIGAAFFVVSRRLARWIVA